MNSPKDHTTIIISSGKDTIYKTIFYRDYILFDDLPDVAKSNETKKEYNEFWNWYGKHLWKRDNE